MLEIFGGESIRDRLLILMYQYAYYCIKLLITIHVIMKKECMENTFLKYRYLKAMTESLLSGTWQVCFFSQLIQRYKQTFTIIASWCITIHNKVTNKCMIYVPLITSKP